MERGKRAGFPTSGLGSFTAQDAAGWRFTVAKADDRLTEQQIAVFGEAVAAEGGPEYRDFFSNAPLAFQWLSPDGIILRVNQAELDLLGYAEPDYTGRRIQEFHVSPAADDLLALLAAGETVRDWEAQVRCKDGDVKSVLIDASPLLRDGELLQACVVTREASGEAAGSETASRLRALVDSSEDAIVSKDLQGTILSWNAAAERLFGYTAAEAVGKSIRMLIPADRQDEEDSVLDALRRGERIEHYETVRQRKDGSLIDISLSVSPVKDGRGRIVGAAKIARDISLRKRAEEATERSMKLKDEFLSLVSHELRTPISMIVGNGNLLLHRRDKLTAYQVQQALEDLALQAERLQSMIENLLLLTRMERSEDMPTEPVQLERLVRAAVDAFSARTGRAVSIIVGGPAPLVMAEPGLLSLVLDNLLSNAGKYSPPASAIEVEFGRAEDGAVEVHVLDRGIGLTEEDVASLFTPFYRSLAAQNRAPGMGLGLAVCHRVAVAQGGRITGRARAGGGADFALVLPPADTSGLAD